MHSMRESHFRPSSSRSSKARNKHTRVCSTYSERLKIEDEVKTERPERRKNERGKFDSGIPRSAAEEPSGKKTGRNAVHKYSIIRIARSRNMKSLVVLVLF